MPYVKTEPNQKRADSVGAFVTSWAFDHREEYGQSELPEYGYADIILNVLHHAAIRSGRDVQSIMQLVELHAAAEFSGAAEETTNTLAPGE